MIGRTFSIWLEMALSLQWIPLWTLDIFADIRDSEQKKRLSIVDF